MDLNKITFNGKPWEDFTSAPLPEGLQEYADFWSLWLSGPDELVVQSSGSTGPPKLISHSAESLAESARRTAQFFSLSEGITCLVALPAVFIAGKMMLVRAAVNGWNMEWIVSSLHPVLPSKKIHFAAFTPPQVSHLLQTDAEKFFAIEKVIIGGGVISESLEEQLRKAPNAIWATYGMSETITHVAARRISGSSHEAHYTGLPNVQFGTDDRACLTITAPYLKEKIITNDVVELKSANEFHWLGRADNVINSGGLKLFPEELERQLGDLISVPFYLGSEPDDMLGERLVLFVENFTSNESDLIQAIKDRVGGAKAPKHIVNQPSFLRTESGKIIRRR
jgi:O-succinylbenzoic acid--CoA ligase